MRDQELPSSERVMRGQERKTFDKKTFNDLKDFQGFVIRHEKLIDETFQEAKKRGRELSDVIYDLFYSEDIDAREYKNDQRFADVKKHYDRAAKDLLDRFLALAKKYEQTPNPPIQASTSSIEAGWIYFKVAGGASRKKMGRMYLNIKPEYLPSFYEAILPEFNKQGVGVDAKIPKTASLDDFNRKDKMVIYFDEHDQQKLLEIIQRFHQDNAHTFIPKTVRFAAEIVDDHGFVMGGVGFGAEPSKGEGSFGDVRSKILAEVYPILKDRNALAGKALETFLASCQKHGVDRTNPAFNNDPNSFSVIRLRQNQTG